LGSGTAGYVHNEAEQAKVDAIVIACRTEQFTLWRNYTIKKQERIKTKMADDVPRYDKLMKQYLNASGMTASAPLTPSAGYSFAIEYLDAAGSVTDLPRIEIFGIMGNKN
jgi:hypothetical protein